MTTTAKPPRGEMQVFDYATAPLTVGAISGSNPGTNSVRLSVDKDARFLVTAISGSWVIASSGFSAIPTLHAEPFVEVVSTAAGVRLWDQPTAWGNIVGDGENPMALSVPYLVNGGVTLVVKFYNYETVAYILALTLMGFKVYT